MLDSVNAPPPIGMLHFGYCMIWFDVKTAVVDPRHDGMYPRPNVLQAVLALDTGTGPWYWLTRVCNSRMKPSYEDLTYAGF